VYAESTPIVHARGTGAAHEAQATPSYEDSRGRTSVHRAEKDVPVLASLLRART
jgi:hypothetical protein